MPSKLALILQFPLQFTTFAWSFFLRTVLILVARIFLPAHPKYQSLRTELQRAYLISCTLHFPEFPHRLPADYPVRDARPISGKGWKGYLIPGEDASILDNAAKNNDVRVVVFGHGGGYARGVAGMYTPYMKRWAAEGRKRDLRVVFLSVEYTLSTEASHPKQRDEFLAAYQYLLNLKIPASRITFMGDSAGGGLCANVCLTLPSLSLPQPSCSILVSPWMDMAMKSFAGGNSSVTSDYFVQANEAVPSLVKLFIGEADPESPDLNPLHRPTDEIKVLNPQLIFVGAAEFALYDAKKWAERCREAGVKTDLQAEWGQLHVWALGSQWIEPGLRARTDQKILDWIEMS